MKPNYQALRDELAGFIPPERLIDDPLRTLAYGTDASFYRLIPQLVVRVEDETEVAKVIRAARRRKIPLTFRAAGTSLSGQAVTDSVLVQLGSNWRGHRISEDGGSITLQPGVIGAKANQYLAPYQRKIGPDPASINAAMIGGIAANNASGMCCGTAQNSYNTVQSMRVILADGTLLDTGDEASRAAFRQSHGALLDELKALADATKANTQLAELIRHKYRLKNTTGYSLNSLVDFDDPFEILQHLMIGSEGTLGFMAEITYRTVEEHPHKASALMLFPDMETTCRAVTRLKHSPVAAVELMDRAGLRSVQDKPGMPAYIRELGAEAAALLVDVRAADAQALQQRIEAVRAALGEIQTLREAEFTTDPDEYALLWKIRKGLFPAVGAVRDTGTTVIIEDVAFPIERLAEGVLELQGIFKQYGYHEALLFGHALEGNLHFVFTQAFSTPQEVERYQRLMDDVAQLVGVKYQGSLKAEHGTGRNMAPFVELEWGAEAYQLMWRIKRLFDPEHLLNPDVILTRNPNIHLENLKPMPPAHELVDKCIECGFCESVCPSKRLTLTPRQRIVSWREINRLEASGEDPQRLARLREDYQYQGLDTCAADGLCAMNCPVNINTGDLTRALRHDRNQRYQGAAQWVAEHFAGVTRVARGALKAADAMHAALGSKAMTTVTGTARKLSGNRVQQWTPSMPKAAQPMKVVERRFHGGRHADKVVYIPSCATRMMGPARGDQEQMDLKEMTLRLLDKAGFEVIIPTRLDGLCCGMAFQSKGQFEAADAKADELNQALLEASENGRYPIYSDTSPCLLRMRETLDERLRLYEPVEFIHDFLLARLRITPEAKKIAVHVTCSATKMGLADKFVAVARACAREVVIPPEVTCCGFAGDKGFSVPELNASALQDLPAAVVGCAEGFSNSRTCEIGLSHHSGIPYHSIVYLVDRCSQPRQSTEH